MGGILSDLIPDKYLIRVSDTRIPRYLNLIRYSDTKKKKGSGYIPRFRVFFRAFPRFPRLPPIPRLAENPVP